MKDYVQIQSSVTINVTPGLFYQDHTNESAHIPDRLKISPVWPKLAVLIKAGQHWYPSEVAEWEPVKALVEKKLATIGIYADTPEGDVEEATSKKKQLKRAISEDVVITTIPPKTKKQEYTTESSLNDISEGD